VEAEKRVQRLLDQACDEVKALAPGWDRDRLMWEINSIAAAIRQEEYVPVGRRRRIVRLAGDLLRELELAGVGIGTAEQEAVFLNSLRMLKTFDGVIRVLGGARRSGLRSLKSSVLRRIVRLYCEAQAKPRFSREGPMVRFVNTVGELALGDAKPFSSDADMGEFRRMKLQARRPDL
jgi:hypothetical protein